MIGVLSLFLTSAKPSPALPPDSLKHITSNYFAMEVDSNAAPTLTDIDNDGDQDLFIGNKRGTIKYYENKGSAKDPSWSFEDIYLAGIDVGNNSNPVFTDIDQDGDADLFIGNDSGYIYFYRNTGAVTAAIFSFVTSRFGNLKTNGNSTPTFADLDEDGYSDLYIGSTNGRLYYYIDDRVNGAKDPQWLVRDSSFSIPISSAPTLIDINGDKKLDLLVGNSDGSVQYYTNDGPKDFPQWRVVGSYLSLDVGSESKPCFVSVNGDTLPEFIIGNDRGHLTVYLASGTLQSLAYNLRSIYYNTYYQDDLFPALADIDADGDLDFFMGAYNGQITHYRNDGTRQIPAWTFITALYDSMNVVNYSKLAFADIDHDDDLDLFTGNGAGSVYYLKNKGTPDSADFTYISTIASVAARATPNLADIDNDGDFDLFVGNSDGRIYFYPNQGSADTAKWGTPNTYYFNIDVGIDAAPFVIDYDNDGVKDLLIGNSNGIIYYRNAGSPQNASFNNPAMDTILIPGTAPSIVIPCLGDIDGDGDPDLFSGDYLDYMDFWEYINIYNEIPMITSTPDSLVKEDSLFRYRIAVKDFDFADSIAYLLLSAPAAMQVKQDSLLWTPLNEDVGLDTIIFKVSDKGGLADTQTFILRVANTNDPPVITSNPVKYAAVNQIYQYPMQVSDADLNDTLTFQLLTSPAGMTIDSKSGLLQWDQLTVQGIFDVSVKVVDQALAADTQTYQLTVTNDAIPPDNPVIVMVKQDTLGVSMKITEITKIQAGDVGFFGLWAKPAPGCPVIGAGPDTILDLDTVNESKFYQFGALDNDSSAIAYAIADTFFNWSPLKFNAQACTVLVKFKLVKDTLPPVITQVTVDTNNISKNSAVISWKTNEESNTLVFYGLTMSYTDSVKVNDYDTVHLAVLTNLAASTLYHYKIIARDSAGNQGSYKDTTFATNNKADTLLPKITTSPTITNITATGVTISFTVSKPTRSEIKYSTDSISLNNQKVNANYALSHQALLDNLTADSRYFVRAVVTDAANRQDSVSFQFKTKKSDSTYIVQGIRLPTQQMFNVSLDSAIGFKITDNTLSLSATLYIVRGGEINYQSIPFKVDSQKNDSLVCVLPDSLTNSRGFSYYIVITEGGVNTYTTATVGVAAAQATSQTLTAISINSYQMISLPLTVSAADAYTLFSSQLGDKTRWIVYGDYAGSGNYLEYPSLSPGEGAWLISKESRKLQITGNGQSPQTAFTIALKNGWNMIGNPYDFPIYWDNTTVVSGSNETLLSNQNSNNILVSRKIHTYQDTTANSLNDGEYFTNFITTGSSYNATHQLKPWSGYWVYCNGSGVSIRLSPTAQRDPQAAAKPVSGNALFYSQMTLEQRGERDGDCIVGLHPSAQEGYDLLDGEKPPFIENRPQISIHYENRKNFAKSYSTDFRPLPEQETAWPVRVSNLFLGEFFTIHWTARGFLPAGYYLFLEDPQYQARINLFSEPAYSNFATAREMSFNLILTQTLLSEKEALKFNFGFLVLTPNPFNPDLQIEYSIPTGNAAPVFLDVLNLRGGIVRSLVNGLVEAGWKRVLWSGTDSEENPSASGTYLLRLKWRNQIQIRKVVLLK